MIGDWIKRQRAARGWTQAELAAQSGIKLSYVKQLEINYRLSPGVDILVKLSRVFGEPLDAVIAATHSGSAPESQAAPVDALRALGWTDIQLEQLQRQWPAMSPAQQLAMVTRARKLERGQQDLERRRQMQREAVEALARGFDGAV